MREGAIHAIIGPNGAGKTTLFNLITGLIKPDDGQVVLEGEDITGAAPWRLVKRGMGRSFQQTNLFWELSSLSNVTLAESAVKDATRKLWGSHPEDIRNRSAALLDRVGLGAFRSTTARELSHGDQRSLEIATALAVESHFLLLDEPTAGMSPAETRTAVELIRKIAREENLTVLFVEHDMEVVFGIADWITVLHYGAVLAEGTPADIRANPDVQRAYLGEITRGGGRRMSTVDGAAAVLEVQGLNAFYGKSQVIFDLDLRGQPRRGRGGAGPERRGQDDRPDGDRRRRLEPQLGAPSRRAGHLAPALVQARPAWVSPSFPRAPARSRTSA